MNRLTSNDKDYIFASLNLFYVKDMEVWLRGGGPEPNYDDTTLVELIRRASKTHNLNIEAEDAESLGDEMYDAMSVSYTHLSAPSRKKYWIVKCGPGSPSSRSDAV